MIARRRRKELLGHLTDVPAVRRLVYHGIRWAWVVAVAALGVLSFPGGAADDLPRYEIGDVPRRDLIAPIAFAVRKSEAEIALEAEGLAASVRPTFEFRPQAYDSALALVERFFRAVEQAAPLGADSVAGVGAAVLGVPIAQEEAQYLGNPGRRNALQAAVGRHLGATLAEGVAGAGVLSSEPAREVILRRGRLERGVLRDSILSYDAYLRRADGTNPDPRSAVASGLYRKLLQAVFRPTVIYNRVETERRRDDLRRTVKPVKQEVRPGERVVAAGEAVDREAYERLEALRAEWEARSGGAGPIGFARAVIGPTLTFGLPVAIFWVLLVLYRRETYHELRQVTLFGLLFGAVIGGGALVAQYLPDRPELVPIPLMAILITVLFNGRLATIAAMVAAMAVGAQPVFRGTPALFIMLVPAVAAALSVRIIRRRNQLYLSIAVIAAAFALAALAVGLTERWRFADIGVSTLAGAINAVGSSALVLMVLPMAEALTRITTDLTLLELSDPSRPLLRRLATEAAGTYAHSIAMANLCERACNAIGANGLLARVGCYYHDVGKLANPLYFVENQPPGANPHDRMKPHKSAQIIREHVEHGLELATKHALPEPVRAFIPEHHGTMPITYFLERAKERGSDEINVADYRYPGPLPQSAETAVAMLADSVEAALRVLDDPSREKVRDAVDHMVRVKIEQGQLRDAPLTLQQLDRIKQEFVAVSTGLRHNRIDYPAAGGGISADWEPDEA